MNTAYAHKAPPISSGLSAPELTPLALTLPQDVTFRAGRLILSILFIASLVAVLHPGVRSEIRSHLLKDTRTVVSTAKGDLRGDGTQLSIVKVKTRNSLILEVYEPQAESSPKLLGRVEMPNAREGYFTFDGQATNLAVDDIDGDGRPEVLVPSFDSNMVGQLSVYRFDNDLRNLHRVSDLNLSLNQ
jgi:hypothetical protein